VIFKLAILNKMFLKRGSTTLQSQHDLKEMEVFYKMLMKIEKNRPKFSAKRVMKSIYPNFFKIK
jgi:hypothetical protein